MAAVGGGDGEGATRPAIVFIGFMAAGKTAAARAAAARLGTVAEDADELIERELGEPITGFFEREGEAKAPPGTCLVTRARCRAAAA